MATRGCGTRVAGGAYIVCPLGPGGRPVEEFLIDAPVPVDEAFGLSAIGLKFLPAAGNRPPMLLDWVGGGSKHRVGPKCQACLAAEVQGADNGKRTFLMAVQHGGVPVADPPVSGGHGQDGLGVRAFGDEVGQDAGQDVPSGPVVPRDPALRPDAARPGGADVAAGEPTVDALDGGEVRHADGHAGPVAPGATFAQARDLDAPLAVNQPGKVRPLRNGQDGEGKVSTVLTSNHADSVLPKPKCTCRWEYRGGHYPNVADFVEEVRVLGMSRRISRSFDFSQIVPGTRHVLVHSRGHIANANAYHTRDACPRNLDEHEAHDYAGMCAGLFWDDLEGGTPAEGGTYRRHVQRTLPCGETYYGYARPEGVTPVYQPAMFLALPAVRIEVVASPDGSHADTVTRAQRSGVRVKVCGE